MKGDLMPKVKTIKKSKTVAFTLNDDIMAKLSFIAEKNSNSKSAEIRRLINEEYKKAKREEKEDL
jgi:predicted transcriptional regulator